MCFYHSFMFYTPEGQKQVLFQFLSVCFFSFCFLQENGCTDFDRTFTCSTHPWKWLWATSNSHTHFGNEMVATQNLVSCGLDQRFPNRGTNGLKLVVRKLFMRWKSLAFKKQPHTPDIVSFSQALQVHPFH